MKHPRKGDKCTIDPDQVYISYSQFIKRHPKYAIRWAYKVMPKTGEVYEVLGVYRHVMNAADDTKNKRCVVIKNKIKQIFLIGNTGVALLTTGEDE